MIISKIYKFLSSAKLAIVLLIAILACCVAGVTVFRGERAWRLIFNTPWFNAILVMLVINVACCFFPRMRGRKPTLILAGMILFHLSFVSILGGIVYNSLFCFRGVIRLTEGEVLPSGDPASYDEFKTGRYFSFGKLKGETALLRMHTGYRVGSEDKRAAYEIEVGERGSKKRGVIYITRSLEHKGFTYFNEKEGYSLLVMLYDRQGKELYGAHVPLQSLKQKDESYLYTTGTKDGPGIFPFPQDPLKPFMGLQVSYRPSKLKERGGEAFFLVWRYSETDDREKGEPFADGKAAIGERFTAGDYYLEAKEVRYWVGMRVRYEPGKPIVLASLWVGLGGVLLTFIGRMRKRKR
jgi:cytochrome c biogenesis protein ResB